MEPLAQAQILPYITGLAKSGLKFILVTFDKPAYPARIKLSKILKERLKKKGIEWVSLKYHNIPNIPAKVYDILNGFRICSKLIKKYNIRIVHARSYVAGAIALLLKRKFQVSTVFDIRGVLFDERADAGAWDRRSIKYKLCKRLEKKLFNSADEIVVLSEKGRKIIENHFLHNERINVTYIPTCVDLDLFKKTSIQAKFSRRKGGLNGRTILVYSGSVGTWYLFDEMVDFFKEFKRQHNKAHFLILTQTNKDELRGKLLKKIDPADFSIVSAPHHNIKDFLSSAYAGISFIKPCYSKQFSCPTKNAEYLACGLPIIINKGIGDTDRTIAANNVGVIINKFNGREYLKNIKKLTKLKNDKTLGARCRNIAMKEYGLKKGIGKYLDIYARLK